MREKMLDHLFFYPRTTVHFHLWVQQYTTILTMMKTMKMKVIDHMIKLSIFMMPVIMKINNMMMITFADKQPTLYFIRHL